MPILEVNQISKSYGSFKAVQDVSFAVSSGLMYGVLGPNGAGKTTTIRMIMNILLPDSGEIQLFGEKMHEGLKDRIGYLPEERGLYTKMKVLDMLIFLGKLHGMSGTDARVSATDLLQRLELETWQEKKIEALSKGMQQKIQFIATIMHDPDLIILDEPFSGLDPINVQVIKEIMMDLRSRGKAIMFSTHQMETAEKLCDDILLINKGQKVMDGPLNTIREKYGKTSIHLEYEGDGKFLKSEPLIEKYDDYGNYVEIFSKEGVTPHQLLKVLVDKVEIKRFERTTSSLNQIFIDTVGRKEDV